MIKESIAKGFFLLCALVCVAAFLMICAFLFGNAFSTILQIGAFDYIFGLDWYPEEEIFGIFPMIIGSLYTTALGIFLGAPLGVLSALYLSFFCPNYLKKYLIPPIELLAAIPSVVYGFFGLVLIVPFLSSIFDGISGKSVLSAGIILSIMILPTIVLVSKSGFDSLPRSYFEAALALGASRERTAFFVLIPAAKSTILAAIILGVGRAIGEAMAIIMVAGNQAQIPSSLLEGARTLTTSIVLEMGYATDLHKEVLILNAVTLFIFILLINLSFRLFKRKLDAN